MSTIQPSSGIIDKNLQTNYTEYLVPKIQEMLAEVDIPGLIAIFAFVKERKIELKLGFVLESALTDFAISERVILLIESILLFDNKAFGKKLNDLFSSIELNEKFTLFYLLNSKKEFTLFIELVRLNETYGLGIDVQNNRLVQNLVQKRDKLSLMTVVHEFKRIGIAPDHQIWKPIVNYTLMVCDVYVLEALLAADFRIVGMDNLNKLFEAMVKAEPVTRISRAHLSHFLIIASQYRVSLNNFQAMESIILSKMRHEEIDGLTRYKNTVFPKDDAEV